MLSLAGRRILITRSRHQASELASLFEAMGAVTILLATIEIAPPLSFAPLDEAIANLGRFDWVVFTSANAVEAFRQRSVLHDRHASAHILTAAIGPATARAAAQIGMNVALIPPEAVAESLSATLIPRISPGSRVLLVRAAVARDHLPEALTDTGAEVTVAEAYRTIIPITTMEEVEKIFSGPAQYPDAITFASSSTVTNLIALLQAANLTLPPSIIRASIGPVTSRTLLNHGFPAHVQAPAASVTSLAHSLAQYMKDVFRSI